MELEQKKHSGAMLWILIGYILMIYGILIFGYGLYHLVIKRPFHTALANIHPDMAWGIIMLIIGFLFYIFNRKHIVEGKK